MNRLLLVLLLVPFVALAQTKAPETKAPAAKEAAPKAAPVAAPAAAPGAPTTPNFCDVAYSAVVEDADNNKVAAVVSEFAAVPWADVEDNHKKQLRVLDALSKEQNKGGPYTVTVTETNTCDGGQTVRVTSGSVYVEGVTLDGSVKVGDVGLQVGKEINDRFRGRATACAGQGKQKECAGWNHKNAKKVKRNELGQVVKD